MIVCNLNQARSLWTVVIAFAILGGVVIPIAFFPSLSYTHPLQRNHAYAGFDRFVSHIAPYMWPTAPVVPSMGDTRATEVTLWTISLAINALIYSLAGYVGWYLARFTVQLVRSAR
jgi:hypothetical protein